MPKLEEIYAVAFLQALTRMNEAVNGFEVEPAAAAKIPRAAEV